MDEGTGSDSGGQQLQITPQDSGEARQYSFHLGPSLFFILDEQTRETLGSLYGGELGMKAHLVPWLGVSLRSGYLIGYEKQENDLDYVAYESASSTSFTPVEVGFHWEILPESRFNPFMGLTAGGAYFAVQQEPEDIVSPIPLYHDELTVSAHQWLSLFGGEMGFDMRFSKWVGAYASGFYRRASTTRIHVEAPNAKRDVDLDLSHAGAGLGIWVYY